MTTDKNSTRRDQLPMRMNAAGNSIMRIHERKRTMMLHRRNDDRLGNTAIRHVEQKVIGRD